MVKYFVKFHTKEKTRYTSEEVILYHETIIVLTLVNFAYDIYKAIEDKTGIVPTGIDLMVAVP